MFSSTEDDRHLQDTGTRTRATEVAKRPILGGYLPVNPVQRYSMRKWDLGDWERNNTSKTFQAECDQKSAQALQSTSKAMISKWEKTADENQKLTTYRLGERTTQLNEWKFELEREIEEVTRETKLLENEMRRSELALQSTEFANLIATEVLGHRQRRVDSDLVHDDVEKNLIKEIEVISNVRMTLTNLIHVCKAQVKANGDAKHVLQMDWSDKCSAHNLDSKCLTFSNNSGTAMRKRGVASFKSRESDPENWLNFSQRNIRESLMARDSSVKLRNDLSEMINSLNQEMRSRCDSVHQTLQVRICQTENANRALEIQLKKTVDEIENVEKSIEKVKIFKWQTHRPLEVAQNRLHHRHQRPNVEMCRDDPAHRLVDEVYQLQSGIEEMESQIEKSEEKLRELQHIRISIDKELDVKRNTLRLDRERCAKIRTHFPSSSTLSGYNDHSSLSGLC